MVFDAVVIGAGPAGMMAAGIAAERGRQVLLLEKNSTPGKKLLLSGKGRCNLTNTTRDVGTFLKAFSPSGIFLRNAFARFFNRDLIAFFEQRGLHLGIERGGRVFPYSNRSQEVIRVLADFLQRSGAKVKYSAQVSQLTKKEKFFLIQTKDHQTYSAKKVVLSTGGLSYPETGSDGFGFSLAKKFGHTLIPPRPGLVGINLEDAIPKKWQGVCLKNVCCTISAQGEAIASEFGEMLFTHFGVSGPIILNLSNAISDILGQGKRLSLFIDFKPALNQEKLDQRFCREFTATPGQILKNILKRLLPSGMIVGFLEKINLEAKKKANQITKKERLSLVHALKGLFFTIRGLRPIREAIVTRGGVATKEINPQTMESKLIPDLYFAGEIIDVDARTGGYNLQAAFSTGYLCGINL